MGTGEDFLRRVVDYWLNEFDWRKQEAALNRMPQFLTEIDDLRVHFVHVRGCGPQPTPLLITHGWPGSFAQMMDLVPRLVDPERFGGTETEAFDVVIPSLPG
jgi:hypothetical protein